MSASRPSPGRLWLDAALAMTPEKRALIGRTIGFDVADRRAFYALLPFAMLHLDERWWVAATNAPPYTQHPDQIALYDPADADVMLYDPARNEARIVGDESPGLFRPEHYVETSIVIFTNPRDFMRQWSEARASHCTTITGLPDSERLEFHEPRNGFMPGALVIGEISRIRWHGMPRRVIAQDTNTARSIQRAIDRDDNRPCVSTRPEGDDAA